MKISDKGRYNVRAWRDGGSSWSDDGPVSEFYNNESDARRRHAELVAQRYFCWIQDTAVAVRDSNITHR